MGIAYIFYLQVFIRFYCLALNFAGRTLSPILSYYIAVDLPQVHRFLLEFTPI